MAKLSSPTGESQNIGSVQAEALSKTMPDVGDDIKGMLKDLEKGRDVTTETQEQFDKIREHLEKIRDTSKEVIEDWDGSLKGLREMSRTLNDLLEDQVGRKRTSISLTRQLTTELQKQIAVQSTGEGITRNFISKQENRVAELTAKVQAKIDSANLGVNLDGLDAAGFEKLNSAIEAEQERLMDGIDRVSDAEARRRNVAFDTLTALSDQVNAYQRIKKSSELVRESWESSLKTIGQSNGKLDLYSKLANRVGLGGLADQIQDRKRTATAAYHQAYLGTTGGADKKTEAGIKAYQTALGQFNSLPGILRAAGKELSAAVSTGMLALTLAMAIFYQLLKIDEEAVRTKRVTGQWADATAVAQFRMVSGVEVLKTITALSEQFGTNMMSVFSGNELARIAEVQKLTGMSAEAAGNMAVQSKINGINTDKYRDSIAAGANKANALNHSAVTLSAVQNEVLNTSRAIAMSYGKNVEGLARAAGAAKALGMSLQDVENISKNLMNFESSIGAEMQAQLLTGRQLNLAKAREYALNNDLEGVAKEIGKQGITAASFSKMNYIQQEAVAKALGMSREEMSKMLVMQMINKGLSADAIAAATHMKKEDIEALAAQERWQTIKQKFLETLVPLLEPVLQVVSLICVPLQYILGAVGWLVKQVSTFGGLISEDNKWARALMGTLVIGIGLFARHAIRARGILQGMVGLGGRLGNIFKNIKIPGFGGVSAGAGAGGAEAANGATKSMGGVQKAAGGFGKNAGNLVKGAFAMVLIAGAMWILAKAVQEFSKVTWDDMLKAGVALVVFAGVAIGVAYALKAAGSALIEAGIYLAIFGVALIPLAFALRLLAPLIEAIGKAIKSVLEGIGTVITSVCEGITKMLTEITLERAAGFMMIALTLPLFGVGLGLAAISMLFFPVKKFTRFMEALGQLKGLGSVASTIRTIADAIGYLADKVSNLSGKDLRALTKVLKSLKGVGLNISTGESAGMTRETLGDTVSVSTVSSNATQAGEQQSSVSKTDLTEVSKKMDRIIEAILSCKPSDWNWIEFHRTYVSNVPDAARGGV